MGDQILQGSLKAISIPDLLTFINMVKKTGTLTLENAGARCQVYWDRGEMIFATSVHPDFSLGAFLIRHGKITEAQNSESGQMVEPGKRQGKVLVQMGILTPKELWWAVKNQVLDIIYSLFQWKDGSFTFEETAESYEEKIKLSVSTTNIIMEGIRRLDEWPRIRELIPSDNLVPLPAPEESRDRSIKFYEDELELFGFVDGRRSIRDIVYISKFSEFETLRILMAFILARYSIVPSAGIPQSPDEVEDRERLEHAIRVYNGFFQSIWGALSSHLDGSEIPELFARALGSSSDTALDGLSFDGSGMLDAKALLANVADIGHDQRFPVLDSALSNLLSFLLFEASRHLTSEEKAEIFKKVESWSVRHG